MKCPACNGTEHEKTATFGVHRCKGCGAIHGRTYLGTSYGIVEPRFDEDESFEGTVYFDLECLGSKGMTRRHGWYRPSTKRIVQVG